MGKLLGKLPSKCTSVYRSLDSRRPVVILHDNERVVVIEQLKYHTVETITWNLPEPTPLGTGKITTALMRTIEYRLTVAI